MNEINNPTTTTPNLFIIVAYDDTVCTAAAYCLDSGTIHISLPAVVKREKLGINEKSDLASWIREMESFDRF